MSVVVGYVPSPEGEAALEHAMRDVAQRATWSVVGEHSRADALVDQRYAQPDQVRTLEEKLDAAGLEHVLQHTIRGRDAAEEILTPRSTGRSWTCSGSAAGPRSGS